MCFALVGRAEGIILKEKINTKKKKWKNLFHINFINLNVEAWVPKVGGAISWKNPLAPCPGLTPFSWHKNQFLCQENCVNRKNGAREILSGNWLYHKCLGPWIFDPRLLGPWEWMNHCLTHVCWHKWELGFIDDVRSFLTPFDILKYYQTKI